MLRYSTAAACRFEENYTPLWCGCPAAFGKRRVSDVRTDGKPSDFASVHPVICAALEKGIKKRKLTTTRLQQEATRPLAERPPRKGVGPGFDLKQVVINFPFLTLPPPCRIPQNRFAVLKKRIYVRQERCIPDVPAMLRDASASMLWLIRKKKQLKKQNKQHFG